MTSVIFKYIGIEGVDPAIFFIAIAVLILILFIITIVQQVKLSKITKKYNKFMDGKDAGSLEEEVMDLFSDIRFLKSAQKKDAADIIAIRNNLKFAYQKVGIVRYDAFREMGGRLSFSIALLNDNNDGYIINSVHSSDGCYTYTKEINGGESHVLLGSEEQEALNKALATDTHSFAQISENDREEKSDAKGNSSESKEPRRISRTSDKHTDNKKDKKQKNVPEKSAISEEEDYMDDSDYRRTRKSSQKAPDDIEVDLSSFDDLDLLNDIDINDSYLPEDDSKYDPEQDDFESLGLEEI